MKFLLTLSLLQAALAMQNPYVPTDDPAMRSIPNYHFRMLRDVRRNDAFYEGLRDAVVPNVSHVLDLGAGTCLLSMMAARLGARRVTAIERHPILAGICRKLVERNGYSHVIHLINDFSTNVYFDPMALINDPVAINEQPDVLVSETFDSWIIEEGFFRSLQDLRERLVITRDTVIVPSKASSVIQLVETKFSFSDAPADISGFDYEYVRSFRPNNVFAENSLDVVYKNLSDAQEMLRYDFQNDQSFDDYFKYTHLPIPITRAGVVHAGCVWFHMHLDASSRTVLKSEPGSESSWNQMIKMFEWGDVFVKPGDTFNLLVAQLPERYTFAYANIGERIIKVTSFCAYPIHVYGSGVDTLVDENIISPNHLLFSFNGPHEFNVWASFGVGQRFQAVIIYPRSADCDIDARGNIIGDGNLCFGNTRQPDPWTVEPDRVAGVYEMREFEVAC